MELDSIMIARLAKLVLLAVLSPFWVPIAKAMWAEMTAALAEHGGLFGKEPSKLELERMRKARGPDQFPLVLEPWAENPRRR